MKIYVETDKEEMFFEADDWQVSTNGILIISNKSKIAGVEKVNSVVACFKEWKYVGKNPLKDFTDARYIEIDKTRERCYTEKMAKEYNPIAGKANESFT